MGVLSLMVHPSHPTDIAHTIVYKYIAIGNSCPARGRIPFRSQLCTLIRSISACVISIATLVLFPLDPTHLGSYPSGALHNMYVDISTVSCTKCPSQLLGIMISIAAVFTEDKYDKVSRESGLARICLIAPQLLP
jgi:hypothetical protein